MSTPDTPLSVSLRPNVPDLTVSELAASLKRTIEDSYGRVRVRGELSKISRPASGHLYTALKDENAVIDAVCWRAQLPRLSVVPEEGIEVICTGRLTTYPARSNYQLIIEQMELAGRGAILKMIEDRRQKLAAEGLFDTARKRSLPFAPRCIGVITSPTGAVIRDILHRLTDRFPVRVLLWPVSVQGDSAAREVTAAIRGMNALAPTPDLPRPDVIIVARGGGSFEDLMPFQDEDLVRAAAASKIPLISAVGHETDTTLIDYAADRRAPTPTAAAEMAVPVRTDLVATLTEYNSRAMRSLARHVREETSRLSSLAARLAPVQNILDLPRQRLDHAGTALFRGISLHLTKARGEVNIASGRLRHPSQTIAEGRRITDLHGAALARAYAAYEDRQQTRLMAAGRMLESLSFHQVLARGYAAVRDEQGHVVAHGADLAPGQNLSILFGDDVTRTVTVGT